MSRLINRNINIPENVNIEFFLDYYKLSSNNGIFIIYKTNLFELKKDNNNLLFISKSINKKDKSKLGTYYSILKSKILGLNKKFKKILILQGVGFKSYIKNNILFLNLGYSHEIQYLIPNDISILCQKNEIIIEGIDKQRVGQIAAEIREKRKPDVYKGKGIKYLNEELNLKEIKKKK